MPLGHRGSHYKVRHRQANRIGAWWALRRFDVTKDTQHSHSWAYCALAWPVQVPVSDVNKFKTGSKTQGLASYSSALFDRPKDARWLVWELPFKNEARHKMACRNFSNQWSLQHKLKSIWHVLNPNVNKRQHCGRSWYKGLEGKSQLECWKIWIKESAADEARGNAEG